MPISSMFQLKKDKLLNSAKTKMDKGDYDGAVEDYSRALDIAPSSESFYNRGVAKNRVHNYSGAIADFTSAVSKK